jgi:hypothetical protein
MLSLMRGTDNQLEVVITDGDGKAFAINSDTIDFTVKDEPGGSVVFTKQNGPGDHSNPGLGETIFNIDAADTASASSSSLTYWVYEVRRTTATLDERVHITGDFVVRPTI